MCAFIWRAGIEGLTLHLAFNQAFLLHEAQIFHQIPDEYLAKISNSRQKDLLFEINTLNVLLSPFFCRSRGHDVQRRLLAVRRELRGEPCSSHCVSSKINAQDPWNDGWLFKVYINHYQVWAVLDVLGITRQVSPRYIYDDLLVEGSGHGFSSALASTLSDVLHKRKSLNTQRRQSYQSTEHSLSNLYRQTCLWYRNGYCQISSHFSAFILDHLFRENTWT